MAKTGMYEDGKKGMQRPSDPDLRIKEMDRDGVDPRSSSASSASPPKIQDHEAATEMFQIYNDWLKDFCSHYPDRQIGLACLPYGKDPAETLEYSYQKQLEQLQNVKKGIADVVTAKKRIQAQESGLQQQVVKLDTQARQALAAGREDLARTALERKNVVQTELQSLDGQVRELEQQQESLTAVRAEPAHEDRAVPHQEGGHQGAVLGRRGAGADLGGRDRRRRRDGRRRSGDGARHRTRPSR